MMSLFSAFDLGMTTFPMLIMVLFLSNIYSFMTKNNMIVKTVNSIKKLLENFFESMKPSSFNKIIHIILFTLFNMLLMLNTTSILSYNFAWTTQLSVIMFMSLSLWVTMTIFSISKSTKNFLTHCIPEGTPIYLVWFLFLIEVISTTIRPITVTVRLLANITAGHLLMTLLANLVLKMEMVSFLYIILNLVELFVALIQSYIYITMICLYYAEVK